MNRSDALVEVVPPALEGERVDRVVSLITGCSRAEAAGLVETGAVVRNGQVVRRGADRLTEGDELAVDTAGLPSDGPPLAEPGVLVPVVHEDAAVIVVDKPAGLVVHPGSGNPGGTLVNGLLALYPELAEVGEAARPGIVHRLDKDTSGLLVVARTDAAYDDLVAQLATHEVERAYRTMVWGHPDAEQGVVDAPIGRSPRQPMRMDIVGAGRPARTHYRVARRLTAPVPAAELRCRLETGRTHQIRVHLAAIGHPVVGDAVYGGDRPALRPPRICLHAERLGFTHPATGTLVSFDSPLPADLAAFWSTLS